MHYRNVKTDYHLLVLFFIFMHDRAVSYIAFYDSGI